MNSPAQNPIIPPAAKPENEIIAGHKCGIQIHCSPHAKKAYDELLTLSNKGNHWARMAMKGIFRLTSGGRSSMENVFTHAHKGIFGRDVFYVSLPGILAIFKSRDDGTYLLMYLKADTSYLEYQKNAMRPGLWRIKKNGEQWSAELVKNGRLRPNDEKGFVAITDRGFENPQAAAASAAIGFEKVSHNIRQTIDRYGFLLHFTPGHQRIAGLVNCQETFNPARADTLKETATLLTNTMYEAKDIDHITWYSEWGGSGILTQAMKNLSDSDISLEKHCVIFQNPTTQPSDAESFARAVKLQINKDGKRGNRPDELFGRLVIIDKVIGTITRWNQTSSTGKEIAFDTSKSIYQSGDKTVAIIGSLATLGYLASDGMTATIAGIAGTAYLLIKAVSSVAKKRP